MTKTYQKKDIPMKDIKWVRSAAWILSEHLVSTKIDVIYASPLLRAHHRGKAVQDSRPKPRPLILNPNLREQHSGVAEGYHWCCTYPDDMPLDECYKSNIFPAFSDRSSRFPGGESVDDLEERAHRAVKECIFPHLAEEDGFHIALASHGLCIGELVHALLSYDSQSSRNKSYTGLMNTAWTRAVISLDSPHQGPVDSNNPPPLSVKVTHINKEDHLTDLYNSTETDDVLEDETKMEALAFFGGARTIYSTVLHITRHGEVNCDRTKTSASRSDYSSKGISVIRYKQDNRRYCGFGKSSTEVRGLNMLSTSPMQLD